MTSPTEIRKADLKFGESQERQFKDVIGCSLGLKLRRTRPYFVFDYECDTAYVELKSRRTPFNQFPTTIIGKNKLDSAKEYSISGKKIYFVFSFPEGLFIWEYNTEQADKIRIDKCGRRDRGRNEIKDYGFIPLEYFTKLE